MAAIVDSPPPEVGEVKMEAEHEHAHPALTPPTSENTDKKDYDSGSDLSDLSDREPDHVEATVEPKAEPIEEPEETPKDEGIEEEIVPDHYYGGGKVPVFKPVSALIPILLHSLLRGHIMIDCMGVAYIHLDHEPVSKLPGLHQENR